MYIAMITKYNNGQSDCSIALTLFALNVLVITVCQISISIIMFPQLGLNPNAQSNFKLPTNDESSIMDFFFNNWLYLFIGFFLVQIVLGYVVYRVYKMRKERLELEEQQLFNEFNEGESTTTSSGKRRRSSGRTKRRKSSKRSPRRGSRRSPR
ncbi:hypothetical protein BLOT_005553 [Blomia tropicalis]|nr:hypothetical protein BLOT_005553 [Blomia tropicalis]